MLPAEEAAELARIALASLEVAPVGEVSEKRRGLVMDGTVDLGGKSTYRIIKGEKAMKRLPLGTKFYIAPPAPAVIQSSQLLHDFYRAYADWLISGGDGQFSCVNGLCANLFDYCDRKGVGSAQALNEMHVQFVTAGMNEKLPFNTSVTDFDAESADGKCHLNTARRKWVFRRIIDGVKPAPVVPEKLPCSVELKPGLIIGKGCKTETPLTALRRRAEYYAKLEAMTPEEREKHGASIEAFKAMLPQPAPVDKEFIPKNLDKALGVVGVALPESKEEFNFQIERWIQRLIDRVIRYADEFKEQPAPVVPDEWAIQDAVKFCRETGRQDAGSAMEAWNACRAAMLNGDIFSGKLNFVNHNFREIAETSTNSPVTPDGWISCSERMPEQGAYISAVSKHGEYVAGQVIDDWLDMHDGTSFGLDEVYLWMMLPPLLASPQQ